MLDLSYEQEIFSTGYNLVGALDEVGRGPLAGPVVAACVLVSPEFEIKKNIQDVRDSKKLSEKKREMLFDLIHKHFLEVGVGICDHQTVDKINILQASFLAMKKALGCLRQKPSFIILDGKFPIPNISLKQQPVIKGDANVFSIAAASIVAKVVRDRIMRGWHDKYPQYGFDCHKGYGTKMHLASIEKYGPCPIHRLSFAPIKKQLRHRGRE